MAKAAIIVDAISREEESAYIDAPFNEGKKALEREGYRIISLEENARLRIQEGVNASISQHGNWTREGVLYVPKKSNMLIRNLSVIEPAIKDGEEFYLTPKQVGRALKNFVVYPSEQIRILARRFGSDPLTVFAFGGGDANKAQLYGDFLEENEISLISIYTTNTKFVDKQNGPFVRRMWFCAIRGDYSSLGGSGWGLSYGGRVRGIRKRC